MLSSSSLFVLVFLSTLKLVLILADSSKGVDQVCYGTLGCFTPLDDPRFPLYPGTPSDVGTTFRLYHQKDPRRYVNIHYEANGVKRQVDPGTVIGKKILGTSKIVLIIHGWMVNHDYELYQELRQALFKVSEWVIAVDWRKGAENPYYPQSVANTALVGRATALLIRRLSRCCNILTSNVHIIGFSLGAHAAGNAGRWFNAQFNEKIGRISALDGAGVLLKNSTLGLNPSDALFVDAIHTSGGDDMEALIGQLGNPHSIGHVDFYPNGGREQTHCLHNPQEISPFCNHHAAIEYYISSLVTCDYRAHQCESWTDYLAGKCQDPHKEARMGYYSFSTNLRGNFYISTQSASPFCESTDHKVCPSRPFWLANALTNLVAGTHNAIAFFFPTNSNKSRIWFQ